MTAPASETTTAAPEQPPLAPPAAAPEPVAAAEPVAVEPAVVEPAPEVLPAVAAPTEVDTVDSQKWTHQTPWPYEWLEFRGDQLAVRTPKGAALNALQMAQSKHVSDQFRSDITSLFVIQHLSQETYERLMYRMVDPNDPDFTNETFSELIGLIANLGLERLKADAAALSAAVAGKAG